MTSGNQWRDALRRRRGSMTELNLATSQRYAACRGKHVPSGEFTIREFPIGQRQLPICANCGVPFGNARGYWGDPMSAGQGGRRSAKTVT